MPATVLLIVSNLQIQTTRLQLMPNAGEVTVADPSGLDFETAQTMQIEVTATSTDGSIVIAETFDISDHG